MRRILRQNWTPFGCPFCLVDFVENLILVSITYICSCKKIRRAHSLNSPIRLLTLHLGVLLLLSCSSPRHLERYNGSFEETPLIEATSSDGFAFAYSGSRDILTHKKIIVKIDSNGKSAIVLTQEKFKGLSHYQKFFLSQKDDRSAFTGDQCLLGFVDSEIIFTCIAENQLESYELRRVTEINLMDESNRNLKNMMADFKNLLVRSEAKEYWNP